MSNTVQLGLCICVCAFAITFGVMAKIDLHQERMIVGIKNDLIESLSEEISELQDSVLDMHEELESKEPFDMMAISKMITEINPHYTTEDAEELAEIIIEQSERYKVPCYVVAGILATESAFRSASENEYTEAIGIQDEDGEITHTEEVNRTVYGMGQISWHYWGHLLKEEGIAKTPYELQSNDIKSVAACCRVFRQYVIKNNGNLVLALCGYSGHTMLDGMDYIESVMRWVL